MGWLVLAFLVPPLFFVLIARRAIRVTRQLKDPSQLRALLSEETRQALQRCDIDPNTVDFETLRGSEELMRLVGHDLRKVLSREILGLGLASRLSRMGSASGVAPGGPGVLGGIPHPRPGAGIGDRPDLPPPIDAGSGTSPVFVLALLLVALCAAATVLLYG